MFISVSEIKIKLIEVAEEMGDASGTNEVVSRILHYIQYYLDNWKELPEELKQLSDLLFSQSTRKWINEEKLLLFGLFLMCRSFHETAARIGIMSEKPYHTAIKKVKELSARYGTCTLLLRNSKY